MSERPNNRRVNAPQVPLIYYGEQAASDAFAAHAALSRCERLDPALRDNPAWAKLRAIAFQQFNDAYCTGGAA